MIKEVIFQAPQVVNNYRVYFDTDTGDISTITNEELLDTECSYIDVAYEQVEKLISGDEALSTCIVKFDVLKKTYELVSNGIKDKWYDIGELIYKIPKTPDADITLIQDLKNTCWKFLISEKLRYSLINTHINLKTTLSFSITQKNNPNILYRTLKLPFHQLVAEHYVIMDFTDDYEFDGLPVSVYTIKKLDSYSYEVIND